MDRLQDTLQGILDEAVASGKERGVQAAVYAGSKRVASCCAGCMDADNTIPVDADTLFPVFSVTKGVTAALIHRMAQDGRLAYDDPVCKYWPEFGRNGKEHVTIRQALCHTAGVPELPNDLPAKTINDWDAMLGVLADMPLQYAPGTQLVYHAMTFGWILGEVARRADGRPFDAIVEEEIASPLSLGGLYIASDAGTDQRVAWLTETPPPEIPTGPLAGVPASITPLTAWRNTPGVKRLPQPASSGVMSADSLARFYASLLPGGVDGVSLLSDATRAQALTLTTGADNPERRAMGFSISGANVQFGHEGTTFGHIGYGGSIGLANLTHGYAFAYTHNHFSPEGYAVELALLNAVQGAL